MQRAMLTITVLRSFKLSLQWTAQTRFPKSHPLPWVGFKPSPQVELIRPHEDAGQALRACATRTPPKQRTEKPKEKGDAPQIAG